MDWFNAPVWQGFLYSPSNPSGHSGVDLGMPIGTPLTALIPGTVISENEHLPWGGQINIQSDYPGVGQIVISYLHTSKNTKKAGDVVKAGQIVAYSGEPTAQYSLNGKPVPHLHFEVSRGNQPPYMGHNGPSNPIDPTFLLEAAQNGTLGKVTPPAALTAALSGAASVQSSTRHVPGFLPIVSAVDRAEALQPIDAGNVFGSALGNFRAVAVRGVVVGIGVVLMLLVVFNLLRGVQETLQPVAADAAAFGVLA